MAVAVEIISPEFWGHLLGEYGREPDPNTKRINKGMFDVLTAGFEAFVQFREILEPQGFHAIRKYLISMPDSDRSSTDVVLLVAENLLHPDTNYQARDERNRYDMPGDMVTGERTFHPNVAVQLRMRAWRRNPDHLGGPDWFADVRIKYWEEILPNLQPYGLIPSFFAASERDYRNVAFTTVNFPVTREVPSQTAKHIRLALTAAKPLILAGFQGPRSPIL